MVSRSEARTRRAVAARPKRQGRGAAPVEQDDDGAGGFAHDLVEHVQRVLRALPEADERDVGPLAGGHDADVLHVDLASDRPHARGPQRSARPACGDPCARWQSTGRSADGHAPCWTSRSRRHRHTSATAGRDGRCVSLGTCAGARKGVPSVVEPTLRGELQPQTRKPPMRARAEARSLGAMTRPAEPGRHALALLPSSSRARSHEG
jgi:hypothetical protein